MKSQKAKEYITPATCTAQEYAERFGGRELVVSRWDVSTAIELAEQEAEERCRNDIARYKQDLEDSRSREVIATKIIEDKRKEIERLKAKAVDAFLLACEKQVSLGGEIKREMYELFIEKLTER